MNFRSIHTRLTAVAIALAVSLPACAGAGSATGEDGGPTADKLGTKIEWSVPAIEMDGLDQRTVGEGPEGAVIISPTGRAQPETVVVYLHHWSAIPPSVEQEAVNVFVRAGNTVIYPAYQDRDSEVGDYLPNAVAGIRTALAELGFEPLELSAVGATTGGALAFDLAAIAAREGLPPFDAAVAIDPGRNPDGAMPRPDYGAIPRSSRLMAVHTPNSRIPGSAAEARRMLRLASSVPAWRKRIQRSGGDIWREVIDWIASRQPADDEG